MFSPSVFAAENHDQRIQELEDPIRSPELIVAQLTSQPAGMPLERSQRIPERNPGAVEPTGTTPPASLSNSSKAVAW